MWKMSKRLAACVLAAAWWGIFYPELCFSEDTCAVVRTENVQAEDNKTLSQTDGLQEEGHQIGDARNRGAGKQSGAEEIDAAAVWQASGDRIIIRSRLWEWCEENLFDASKKEAQSVSEDTGQSAPAGRES